VFVLSVTFGPTNNNTSRNNATRGGNRRRRSNRRNNNASNNSNSQIAVGSNPRSLSINFRRSGQTVLPFQYHTVLEQQYTGFVAAGNLGAGTSGTAINYFTMLANGIYQPWGTGNAINATGAGNGNVTSTCGSASTNSPIGYGFFAANYNTYKVLEYEAEWTVTPQNSGDTVAFAMWPEGDQQSPTSGTFTYQIAAAQTGAVSGVAVNGANSRLNTLRLKGKVHIDLGLNKRQWLDAMPIAVGTSPTGVYIDTLGFMFCTMDGAVNTASVVVSIKIRQRVIFSDRVQFGN